jgi:hypothetical protein
MTFYNKGSLVSWSGGGRGGAVLNGRAPLGKRAVLGGGLVF